MQSTFYLKYTVISAFIGDFFVTNKTSFDSLRFFPTNFSNWLQGNVNSPKYSLDDPYANQIDIKISSLKDNDNQLAFYSKNLKFKIVRDVETHNAQEHVDHITSDILVRNSIDFFEAKASVQSLLLRNAQVSNWFNLLSKNDEINYRIIGQTKTATFYKRYNYLVLMFPHLRYIGTLLYPLGKDGIPIGGKLS